MFFVVTCLDRADAAERRVATYEAHKAYLESASVRILVRTNADPAILSDVDEVFDAMAHYHPKAPHWYLPLIGADPARQGQGIGSALMRHALVRCDHDGVAAYLESSNPRNILLYQRHGFEILGTIQAGSSPFLTPMLRRPQPATG